MFISDDPLVVVELPGPDKKTHIRKRTVGTLDMGGGSFQIAYEVPKSVRFSLPQVTISTCIYIHLSFYPSSTSPCLHTTTPTPKSIIQPNIIYRLSNVYPVYSPPSARILIKIPPVHYTFFESTNTIAFYVSIYK